METGNDKYTGVRERETERERAIEGEGGGEREATRGFIIHVGFLMNNSTAPPPPLYFWQTQYIDGKGKAAAAYDDSHIPYTGGAHIFVFKLVPIFDL